MAYTAVQKTTGAVNSGVGISVTDTFGAPVGTGNTVVGVVAVNDNSTGITVVDNHSVPAPQVLLVRDAITTGNNYGVFVKTGVTGGPTQYTATNTGGGANSAMTIFTEEYSGFLTGAAVDGTPVGVPLSSSVGANSMSSGNTTTASPGDFVWSFAWLTFNGATMTPGTTPPYTLNNNNQGGLFLWSEWLTQAAAGSIAGTWQCSATGSTVVVGVVALTRGGVGLPFAFLHAPLVMRSPGILAGSALIKLLKDLARNPIRSRRRLLTGGDDQ